MQDLAPGTVRDGPRPRLQADRAPGILTQGKCLRARESRSVSIPANLISPSDEVAKALAITALHEEADTSNKKQCADDATQSVAHYQERGSRSEKHKREPDASNRVDAIEDAGESIIRGTHISPTHRQSLRRPSRVGWDPSWGPTHVQRAGGAQYSEVAMSERMLVRQPMPPRYPTGLQMIAESPAPRNG
jgi:hypothetical protein